jgi:hypothetical protein
MNSNSLGLGAREFVLARVTLQVPLEVTPDCRTHEKGQFRARGGGIGEGEGEGEGLEKIGELNEELWVPKGP